MLVETGRHIDDSRRSKTDTETIGSAILQNVHQQHNSLLWAKNPIVDIDGGFGTSRSIVASMNRRAYINRVAPFDVFGGIA